MAERLPVGSARTVKSPSLNSFGSSPDYAAPSSNTLNRPNSRETDSDSLTTVPMFSNGTSTPVFDSGSYRQQANHAAEAINRISTRSKESEPRNENEWVEQDEPGVYITLTALAGGARDLKRVRFRYQNAFFLFYSLSWNVWMLLFIGYEMSLIRGCL